MAVEQGVMSFCESERAAAAGVSTGAPRQRSGAIECGGFPRYFAPSHPRLSSYATEMRVPLLLAYPAGPSGLSGASSRHRPGPRSRPRPLSDVPEVSPAVNLELRPPRSGKTAAPGGVGEKNWLALANRGSFWRFAVVLAGLCVRGLGRAAGGCGRSVGFRRELGGKAGVFRPNARCSGGWLWLTLDFAAGCAADRQPSGARIAQK